MFKRISLLGLVLAALLSSCDTDDNATPDTLVDLELTTAEDISSMQYLVEDTEAYIDENVEFKGPGDECAEITFKQPRGQFPNTITIDFGDGCEGPGGHIRKGKIVIEQSAPMAEEGASRSVTLIDFYVDEVMLEGTKLLTNEGYDDFGNVTYSRSVDVTATFPGGLSAGFSASHTKTQIQGGHSAMLIDDVFEITGSASGYNRFGKTYDSEIVEPLVKARNCKWIQDGVRNVKVASENGMRSRSLDYGFPNEQCDNLVQVTFANGATKVIRIHAPWWK